MQRRFSVLLICNSLMIYDFELIFLSLFIIWYRCKKTSKPVENFDVSLFEPNLSEDQDFKCSGEYQFCSFFCSFEINEIT